MSRVSDTGTDLSAAALPAGDFRNSSSAGKIEESLMRQLTGQSANFTAKAGHAPVCRRFEVPQAGEVGGTFHGWNPKTSRVKGLSRLAATRYLS
jgi:hypothetical protein